MKQILTVFGFTFRDAVRKKAFIISSVILAIIIAAVCAIPAISTIFNSGSNNQQEQNANEIHTSDKNDICYYLDEKSIVKDGKFALAEAYPDIKFETAKSQLIDTYKQEIKNGDACALVIVTEDKKNGAAIEVVSKDFMTALSANDINSVLSNQYSQQLLKSNGVDDKTITAALTDLPLTETFQGEMDMAGYAMGILLTMVIFFAVYYYGYGVAMSIATEKSSRVMETLVVSAKPSRILIGKCFAMGVLGFLQFAGTIIWTVICYNVFVPDGYMLFGSELSFSAFDARAVVVILLYFIFGYALYAMLDSVCGASVSKLEDVNSALMPVMMLTLISFYVGYFSSVMSSGEDLLQKIAIYVPFTSPFIVPFRILNGEIETTTIIISLLILAVSIAIVAMISIRIYSASVMHYGKRLTAKDMLSLKN